MPIDVDPLSARRRHRRAVGTALFTLLLIGLLWTIQHRTAPPPRQPGTAVAGDRARPHSDTGVRCFSFSGTPYDVGRQHGVALKRDVQRVVNEFLYGSCLTAAGLSKDQALKAAQSFAPYLPQTFVDELHGLSEGAAVAYDDLLVLHAFPELVGLGDGTAYAALPPATESKELLLGVSFDRAPRDLLADCAVILAVHAEGSRGWVGLGFAGLITPLAGMNDRGLSAALLRTADAAPDGAGGLPALFLPRCVLENDGTIRAAGRRIEAAKRTMNCTVLVGQTEDDVDAAVIEAKPTKIAVRPARAGRLVATNHFRALADPPLADEDPGPCARYDAVHKWLFDHAGQVNALQDPLGDSGVYGPNTVVAVLLRPVTSTLTVRWKPGEPLPSAAQRLTWESPSGRLSPAGGTGER